MFNKETSVPEASLIRAISLKTALQSAFFHQFPQPVWGKKHLGEENGGILLDVNDAGFSMQTAFPLDPGNPHLRRARFSGNGDFEIDCELAWDQSGQAGFRFPNTSADMRGRL